MSETGFVDDEKTVFAVVRALEIIGEASKKIPEAVRERHLQVPVREMAAMRDKLAHDYFGVNAEVVWKTLIEDLLSICEKVRRVLDQES
jgi:uncharacterized protein with HEPN domain